MRTVAAVESISLDGVMQAPGRPDEDERGRFAHGGWAVPYAADPVQGRVLGGHMRGEGDLLFGRRTYQDFLAVWPGRTDNPFSPVLDAARKYVVSRTLTEPLPWANSVLLPDDAAVKLLRGGEGPRLTVLGSGELVRSLLAADLVDELLLLVHPLVLGAGRRLFAEEGAHATLRLVDTMPTGAGVLINHYVREGAR
jgi:dihydrofolate reductase